MMDSMYSYSLDDAGLTDLTLYWYLYQKRYIKAVYKDPGYAIKPFYKKEETNETKN